MCGGGTTSEPPTMSPTASLVPIGTFAPTRSPLEATNYDELDAFSQLDGAVIEVTQDIHWPVNSDDLKSYRISIEHRSVWIWSSVNAALDGGRSDGYGSQLFHVEDGGALTLSGLTIRNGYSSTYHGTPRGCGGAISVLGQSMLHAISCVIVLNGAILQVILCSTRGGGGENVTHRHQMPFTLTRPMPVFAGGCGAF